MNEFLLTNNPMVQASSQSICPVEFIDGSLMNVMIRARDYVHKGYKLLTHPLSGSIKPNQTPYKSILMQSASGAVDSDSLRILEGCIHTCKKLNTAEKDLPDLLLRDYMLIDSTLIEGALASCGIL